MGVLTNPHTRGDHVKDGQLFRYNALLIINIKYTMQLGTCARIDCLRRVELTCCDINSRRRDV
jgi:hypothetical protein